ADDDVEARIWQTRRRVKRYWLELSQRHVRRAPPDVIDVNVYTSEFHAGTTSEVPREAPTATSPVQDADAGREPCPVDGSQGFFQFPKAIVTDDLEPRGVGASMHTAHPRRIRHR